jgi:Domain of unknown function (DUF4886)
MALCKNFSIVLCFLAGLSSSVSSGEICPVDSAHVLFLGNSYTAGNNLPQLFTDLAASGGKTVETDRNTPGGFTLYEHSQDAASLAKIAQGGWDYVVLQEQSQYPTIEYYRINFMYPGARSLDQRITDVNAKTMFFMTWGREYGGKQVINGHGSPPFSDYFEMQEALRAAYVGISDELSAQVAPVGMAWQCALTLNSPVDLWTGDHSHPTYQGSYLAACVFYAKVFNESPIGLPFIGTLPADTALLLQFAGHHTVFSIHSIRAIPDMDLFAQTVHR